MHFLNLLIDYQIRERSNIFKNIQIDQQIKNGVKWFHDRGPMNFSLNSTVRKDYH